MAAILQLINNWQKENPEADYRVLFKDVLHKEPYCLKYSTEKKYPELLLVHHTPRSDTSNDVVQECNGIIFRKDDFTIIARGMSVVVDQNKQFLASSGLTRIEESEDGTVIRLFYYKDSWVVSTNKRIDAGKAFWESPKSFKILFLEAVRANSNSVPQTELTFFEWLSNSDQILRQTLDIQYIYSMILLHPENTLVIKHTYPKLVFVSARNSSTFEEIDYLTDLMPEWATAADVLTVEEAQMMLEKDGIYKGNKRGIILSDMTDLQSVKRYKIDYNWYKKGERLRKNQHNMWMSYLNCNADERLQLREFYPEVQLLFDNIDACLETLKSYLFIVYRNSYIRKRYLVPQDHPAHNLVRRIHTRYKVTKVPIIPETVADVINKTPSKIVHNAMYFISLYGAVEPCDS